MNYDITTHTPDDDNYPDECLEDIVFGCPKPPPRIPVIADTIAVIGVSRSSIRVVLNAERVVYAGKWMGIPDYVDVGERDKAYYAEFKLLAMHMHLRQVGQNGVQVFANFKVA